MKKRGSSGKPEVATVSLVRGVFGGDRRTKTEPEREQSNGGEFLKTLTPSASMDITHTLELEIQLSLSLAQHFLFETFSCFKLDLYRTRFFLSFSRCTMLDHFNISFSYLQILSFTSKSDRYDKNSLMDF
jgi:hypothetical protein